ncbi:hypothetical protein [Cellulomonas sp.]|uniref:hypothetical protein n=1 Tax=Cellulomonas sp. TaxID=40001 RepID=UPI001B2B3A4E|nr:hypothetical protein [Cellulomonas sp.]MBO9555594.1 hypothetical protein [Cellulomonas sp.]
MAVTVIRPGAVPDGEHPEGWNAVVAEGHLFVLATDKDRRNYNAAVYAPGAWLRATVAEELPTS